MIPEHAEHPGDSRSLLLRWRLFQVRAFAAFLVWMGHRARGRDVIVRLRSRRWSRSLLEFALAYRRTFTSFTEAQATAANYIAAGHEHPDDIRYHISISETIRESDYPLLLYLAPIAGRLRRVFDLGGHAGNLFYAYSNRICFSPDLIWTIYDLPAKKAAGKDLAAQRAENRIRFASSILEASASDVLIASGSIHYFDQPLDEMLASLDGLPAHVFVNRSPWSPGNPLITVQDNRSYLVPCKLHSRAQLIAGMASLGYFLVAEWPVHELKLCVPLYPDLSARTYSGFYFKQKMAGADRRTLGQDSGTVATIGSENSLS